MVDIKIDEPEVKIDYRHKIMLVGSCFTEHIGDRLADLKFRILQNPNGIVFDPSTVASSVTSYIENKKYCGDELIQLNELWQSWQHHGRYSGISKDEVLQVINQSQQEAHTFLQDAKWLIITLGTSFSYRLTNGSVPVANCHRAPSQWFDKHMMTIDETITVLDTMLYRLFKFNPDINIIFTVSPVRHIRDGIIDNNRSKARLLEAVHHLVNKFSRLHYFPSYELVIDVLRDYRFYDIDLVHPNYQATSFVIEQFIGHYVNESSVTLLNEIEKIVIARRHKSFQPDTDAHKNFLKLHAQRTKKLMDTYPFLSLQEELDFFGQGHA
ncbi:MAG TPA: GSCFA domain-containing protein, partial [Flavitalea sp.]|nr:GSCFA domain-containing protein [Flavitalea sp.]